MSSTVKPKVPPASSCSSTETTPKSNHSHSPGGEKKMLLPLKKLLPRRPGIAWAVGTKLEAMDYLQKWYPAKIVEVNEDEQKVLIHFDGWNSRFDEWVNMRSERVRALNQAHAVERSTKDKASCSVDYKLGDHVLAKATDGSPYPAEICSFIDDGLVEVKFFDGHCRTVKMSKLQPLPDQLKSELVAVRQSLISSTKDDHGTNAEAGARLSRREALLAKRAEKEARERVDLKLKALAEKAAKVIRNEVGCHSATLAAPADVRSEDDATMDTQPSNAATAASSPGVAPDGSGIAAMPKAEPVPKPAALSPPRKKRRRVIQAPVTAVAVADANTAALPAPAAEISAPTVADKSRVSGEAPQATELVPSSSSSSGATAGEGSTPVPVTHPPKAVSSSDDSCDSFSSPSGLQGQRRGRKFIRRGASSVGERSAKSARRLVVGGIFKARGGAVHSSGGGSKPRPSVGGSELRRARKRRWSFSAKRHRSGDRSQDDDDSTEEAAVLAAIAAATSSAVSGRKRKCTLAQDIDLAVAAHDLESSEDDGRAADSSVKVERPPQVVKRRARADIPVGRVARRRRGGKRRMLPYLAGTRGRPTLPNGDAGVLPHLGYVNTDEPAVAAKAFKVEEDHNHFKCIYEGCDKSFRKESLLAYHVKYYHLANEPDNIGSTTSAAELGHAAITHDMVSTDSDISVGGGTPSPADAALPASAPALPPSRRSSARSQAALRLRDAGLRKRGTRGIRRPRAAPRAPAGHERGALRVGLAAGDQDDVLLGIDDEEEEALSDDSLSDVPSKPACEGPYSQELINCICGFSEEEGLMIQCDSCLRWQHAACFGMAKETLPSKYVCFLCHDTAGLKTSNRYLHDLDFFTQGKLPSFSLRVTAIQNGDSDRAAANLKTSHELIAKMLHLRSVTTSLKKELCVLRSNDKQELCRWRLPSQHRQSHDVGRAQPAFTQRPGMNAVQPGLDLGAEHNAGTPPTPQPATAALGRGTSHLWSRKVQRGGRNVEKRRFTTGRGPPGHAAGGRLSSGELTSCRAALLEAVLQAQENVTEELSGLEQQIVALEHAAGIHTDTRGSDPDMSCVKRSLSSLVKDMNKVSRIASLSA